MGMEIEFSLWQYSLRRAWGASTEVDENGVLDEPGPERFFGTRQFIMSLILQGLLDAIFS
jgi:hypothetical protein